MKYLKRIFELTTNTSEFDKSILKDFCETNLSYLVDEGLEVNIYPTGDGFLEVVLSNTELTWNEMKDHLLPFFTRLQTEYKLECVEDDELGQDISFAFDRQLPSNKYTNRMYCNLDTVIKKESLNTGKDNLDNFVITSINFYIADK